MWSLYFPKAFCGEEGLVLSVDFSRQSTLQVPDVLFLLWLFQKLLALQLLLSLGLLSFRLLICF